MSNTKPKTEKDVALEKAKQAMMKVRNTNSFKELNTAEIQHVLGQYKSQIAQALPKHLSPDRMTQMMVTMINKNDKIASCNAASLVGALMQASILGFKPVEALGECYFVPYKNQIQFQIGYKGYISLARRSGQIRTLYAEVVYADDHFEYELGLEPILKHKPNLEVVPEDDNISFSYAVAHYKDGGYNYVVLSRNQIEALRKRSPMQGVQPSGAWKTDYAAMAKAKAVKQLAKWMPLSDEQQAAFLSDQQIITPEKFDTRNQSGLKIDEVDYSLYEELGLDKSEDDVSSEQQTAKQEESPKEEPVNEQSFEEYYEDLQKVNPKKEVSNGK